ncbi:MAG: ABC transporter permease [Mesorhizobium sp.]|nr:ABC transporter permease [Mesorhizobium sp.]
MTNDSTYSHATAARQTPGKRIPFRWGRNLLILANALICFYLVTPIIVVVITSFSADQFMQFPPSGWSLRWYEIFFEDRRLLNGLWLSVTLAAMTALVAGAVGSVAAYALHKSRSGFAHFLRSLHSAPLITPGVVTGLAMLIYFSAIGLRGTFLTLLIGHVVLAIPFVVMIVSAGVKSFDSSIEEAAISLGANPYVAFLTVTFPAIKVSMISGALFAFLNSFDEVVVTLFLPGPRTKTLPVIMFEYVQHNLDPLPAAISTVLITISVVIVLIAVRVGNIGRLAGAKITH